MVWNVRFAKDYGTCIDKALYRYRIMLRNVIFEQRIARCCRHANHFEYILYRHWKAMKRPPFLALGESFVCFRCSCPGCIYIQCNDCIDVIVPRGGKNLIARVQADARVPVIGHLEGLCHVYVHASAKPEMARDIVLNAKMRRTGICGAAETLLIDRAVLATHWPGIADALVDAGCELRGDAEACALDSRVQPATEADWLTEYLDAILAVRIVGGVDEAIAHIETHGSGHTECIVAEDAAALDPAQHHVVEAAWRIEPANPRHRLSPAGHSGAVY